MSKRFGRSQKRKLHAKLEEVSSIAFHEKTKLNQAFLNEQKQKWKLIEDLHKLERRLEELTCSKNITVERFSRNAENPSLKITEIQLNTFRFRIQGDLVYIDALRYAKEFAQEIERQVFSQLAPLIVQDKRQTPSYKRFTF